MADTLQVFTSALIARRRRRAGGADSTKIEARRRSNDITRKSNR